MKIVMLIDTLGYGGGAERQFAGLAMALHNNGYSVKVLAYHNEEGYQNDLKCAGIDYCILTHKNTQLSKLNAVRRGIFREKPDVVISYKDAPNMAACILKASGAKWRLIVSDRNTLQNINRTVKLQYGLLYRFADAIVPNSYAQRDFIVQNFNHLSKKIHVITNFTDTDSFKPSDQPRAHNEDAKKRILVVARIARQKNVHRFLEVVRLLKPKWEKQIKITWFGRPNVNEEQYYEKCKHLIVEFGISDIFEFHKPVIDIERVYREYDLFCLPSLWEGFPNALCEAMSSGLLVCASDICDNEHIISDEYNGILFNPVEIEDMASKIDWLLSISEDQKKALVANARHFALDNLSIKTFADRYIELINTIN